MPREKTEKPQNRLMVIPLGGIGEIGKNMTALQYEDDILVIDSGLKFPEEEMLGVDIVIPDVAYLIENREKVRGIVLTHGHEDHIGGLPYVLKQISPPVFGTKLTMGLVEGKLEEHGVRLNDKSRVYKPGDKVKLGCFTVEPVRVNHSIPDAVALAIQTPVGFVVHTGDFKIDHTPVDGQVTDFHRLAELGDQGVLLLLCDSTNAERPGFTPSEKLVGQTIMDVLAKAKGRVLVASFASNVHRIQQVIDAAVAQNRRVAVIGRSVENTVEVAHRLGYLNIPDGITIDVTEMNRFPANQIAIITTGSQGEPMSALARMSMAEHKAVEIVPGDTVLIAATPVPGNEKSVARTINNLFKRGADVVYQSRSGVHVSGHGSEEEIKLMLNLIRPKFFVPVHGEYKHLVANTKLAQACGVAPGNILISENGTVMEFSKHKAAITGKVASGQVLVDGLGVGDVGNIVLRDRRQLGQDGILIVVMAMDKESGHLVGGPDLVSRGFVYVRESEQLLDEARDRVKDALDNCEDRGIAEWAAIKNNVRDALGKLLFDRTRRRPMILPIIVEV